MCHPKHDLVIEELLFSGRIGVDPFGTSSAGLVGVVFLLDGRTGRYKETAEQVEQAGKRPAAGLYRRFSIKYQGKTISLRTNRVIGVAMHGATPPEFDHVNDDSLDCHGDNLHPKTRQENETKKRYGAWMREQGLGPMDEEQGGPASGSVLDEVEF